MSATPLPALPVPALGLRFRAWRQHHAWSLLAALGRLGARPVATLLTWLGLGIALALPLALGIALRALAPLQDQIAQSRQIVVFLRPEVEFRRARALAAALAGREDVQAVEARSPEQGLAELRQRPELAEALAALEGNPLPSVLVVVPRNEGSALAAALAGLPETEGVQDDAQWRQRLEAWLTLAERLLRVLGALLGAGLLLGIGNAVRADIAGRAAEIAVMDQLGAGRAFIRRPYLYLGIGHGLGAALVAIGLLALAAGLLLPALRELASSYGAGLALRFPGIPATLVLLTVAAAVGGAGAWLATARELRRLRPGGE
jgi:cell division transport system permease protein